MIPNELLVRVARTDYADGSLRNRSEHEFGRQANWENLEPLEFMQRLAALMPRPRLHLIRRFPWRAGAKHKALTLVLISRTNSRFIERAGTAGAAGGFVLRGGASAVPASAARNAAAIFSLPSRGSLRELH